jgi:two-component system nitrate/nitrite response regulator NarL
MACRPDEPGAPIGVHDLLQTLPMDESRASVVVADDHPVYRGAIAGIVEAHPELELAGQADTGRSAIVLIASARPDVAVVDLRMPDLDGMGVLRAVVRDGLPTRVVLLTAEADGATAHDAVAAGAAGFLSKQSGAPEIGAAIVAVARGATVLAPEIQAGLAAEIRARSAGTPRLLSDRELEVLRLTADGHSAPEIGRRLYLSGATVKTHLQRVYEKLGVTDRASAVAEGMRRGLLE